MLRTWDDHRPGLGRFDQIGHNRDTECLLHADKMTNELRARVGRYARVHREKLTYELRHELERGGIGQDDDGFIRVPSGFATAYMCLLAYSISKQIRSSPMTSEEDYRGVVLGEMLIEFAESESDNGQQWRAESSSSIMTLSMKALKFRDDVEIGRLIKFRRDNDGRLAEFRHEIEHLTAEVQTCENQLDAIDRAKTIYRGTVEPALRRLQQDISGAGLNCVSDGLIKIGTFSLPTAGLAELLGQSGGAALGLSAALTLSGMALKGYLDRQRLRSASPYTYLLDIHRQFVAT